MQNQNQSISFLINNSLFLLSNTEVDFHCDLSLCLDNELQLESLITIVSFVSSIFLVVTKSCVSLTNKSLESCNVKSSEVVNFFLFIIGFNSSLIFLISSCLTLK